MKTLLIVTFGLLLTTAAHGDEPPAKGPAATKAGTAKAAVTATGSVQLIEVAQVGAQVAGTVQKITVGDAAAVAAGDVLAQLDSAPYEAEVRRAQAGVERAMAKVLLARAQLALGKRHFERLAKLRESKAVDE